MQNAYDVSNATRRALNLLSLDDIELGLGLLSIGRTWGVAGRKPPSPEDAVMFLGEAYAAGLRFFDTAPAYGRSEELLGRAIRAGAIDRSSVRIATKMGEYWDDAGGSTFVDHRYERLVAGLEKSLQTLGGVDIIQVHKATSDIVLSKDVLKALDTAEKCGVRMCGASVSDLATFSLACSSGRYDWVQLPFSIFAPALEEAVDAASGHGVQLIVNRPFGMGAVFGEGSEISPEAAFRYILEHSFSGIVLTGTGSIEHLRQNIAAFKAAAG